MEVLNTSIYSYLENSGRTNYGDCTLKHIHWFLKTFSLFMKNKTWTGTCNWNVCNENETRQKQKDFNTTTLVDVYCSATFNLLPVTQGVLKNQTESSLSSYTEAHKLFFTVWSPSFICGGCSLIIPTNNGQGCMPVQQQKQLIWCLPFWYFQNRNSHIKNSLKISVANSGFGPRVLLQGPLILILKMNNQNNFRNARLAITTYLDKSKPQIPRY